PNDVLFVMTPSEYERNSHDPKLEVLPPKRVIPFPDGKPGFYFAKVRYSQQADAIFTAGREQGGTRMECAADDAKRVGSQCTTALPCATAPVPLRAADSRTTRSSSS